MKELNITNLNEDPNLQVKGVYKLFLYEGGKPISISRFLDKDQTGLVYIGATEKRDLAYRLKCFLGSKNHLTKHNNHSWGFKIAKNTKLIEITTKLIFKYEVIPVLNDAKEEERKQLKNYIDHFGEVPPLNG